MLTAYLDESGHDSKDWMCLAGFLGNENQWKDCSEKWRIGLGPNRKSLHMRTLRWNNESTSGLSVRDIYQG